MTSLQFNGCNRNYCIARKQMCLLRNNESPSNIETANKSKRLNDRKKLIPLLGSAHVILLETSPSVKKTLKNYFWAHVVF